MVFIVAEIGINWDGDFKLVKDLMKNAKKVGFNAVKFQAFDESITKNHPESNRLLKSSISNSNVNKLIKFLARLTWNGFVLLCILTLLIF